MMTRTSLDAGPQDMR